MIRAEASPVLAVVWEGRWIKARLGMNHPPPPTPLPPPGNSGFPTKCLKASEIA